MNRDEMLGPDGIDPEVVARVLRWAAPLVGAELAELANPSPRDATDILRRMAAQQEGRAAYLAAGGGE